MNAWTASAIAAACVLLVLANRRQDVAYVLDEISPLEPLELDATGADGEATQGGAGAFGFGTFDWLSTLAALDPLTYVPPMTGIDNQAANERAFLMMIRHAEGTAGSKGYRTMFGYRYFDSFADHPRSPVQFTDRAGRRLWTSAAGGYQFMAVSPIPGGGSTRVDTWDRISAKLGLVDFSPASQDAAALGLIDEQGALNDVRAGRFDAAISKVRTVWASLPGAGYAQPERSLAELRQTYIDAGGSLA